MKAVFSSVDSYATRHGIFHRVSIRDYRCLWTVRQAELKSRSLCDVFLLT